MRPELNLLLDVLGSRQAAAELECVQSRIDCNDGEYPAYEVQAKQAKKDADFLHRMISTLLEIRRQPENEPFTTNEPERLPTYV